jgi:hypothetical protein
MLDEHTVSPSGGDVKYSVGRFARKLACAYRERIVQAEAPSRLVSAASPGRTADACTGLEILRLPVAVSAAGDLRAGRRGAGTPDAGQLGRRNERVVRPLWKRCGVM